MKMKTLAPRILMRIGVSEAAQVQRLLFLSSSLSFLLTCWQRGRRKIEMYLFGALLLWVERSNYCFWSYAFILCQLNSFYLVCNIGGTTVSCLCRQLVDVGHKQL
jgi:hypothetical protein